MTRETVLSVAVLAVLFAILMIAMARSWRVKQQASSRELPPMPTVPGDLGQDRTPPMEGSYVATTPAGDWLQRVPEHGLGVRSPAVVQVHDTGVTVRRTGAPDLFIPAADVVGAFRSGGMTGKYTGGKGLVVVRWRLHDAPDVEEGRSVVLDTGLHLRHAADRDTATDAVTALAPPTEETP